MQSLGPQRLGLCSGDIVRCAAYVNQATQELIGIAGEDGWWGNWAKLVFNVYRNDPYITLPSQFARAISMNFCRTAVPVQNEWYETLEAGIGLRTDCDAYSCGLGAGYDRAPVPTAYSLTDTNQKLRVYITDSRDVGKRIAFMDAKDQNGNGIYSTDVQYQVLGFYLRFAQPFVTSDFIVTKFSGVLKDQTFGDVVVKQVDATTGAEVLLARYGPRDTAPMYRRYLLTSLPCGCCQAGEPVRPAQVTVMAKYEYYAVQYPTDYLLIQNVPALIEYTSSIRHRSMDDIRAKAMGQAEELKAISLLNQQLAHYLGKIKPAIVLAPFGIAHLRRERIGTLM